MKQKTYILFEYLSMIFLFALSQGCGKHTSTIIPTKSGTPLIQETPVSTNTQSITSAPTNGLRKIEPGWIAVINWAYPHSIHILSTDGLVNKKSIETGPFNYSVDWSPDSRWIVTEYSSDDIDNMDLFKIKTDGSQIDRLTKTTGTNEMEPSWSFDGRYIAFIRRREIEIASIWILDLESSAIWQIPIPASGLINPSFSPDGLLISYQKYLGINPEKSFCDANLYTMKMDGIEIKLVTEKIVSCESQQSWSPDGQWISFTSYESQTRNGQIYTIRPNGTDLTQLTDLPGNCESPTWSPDGKHIAFIYTDKPASDVVTQHRQIYIMNSDGTGISLLKLKKELNQDDWVPMSIKWGPVPSLAIGYSYTITEWASPLNLLDIPNNDGSKIATLLSGDGISVLEGPVGEVDFWYRVRTESGVEGWVEDIPGRYVFKE